MATNPEDYAVWKAAEAGEAIDRQSDENLCGFWRKVGAKTKEDIPIAIWRSGASGQILLRQGGEGSVEKGSKSWNAFVQWAWPHCVPTSHDEYQHALKTGFWSDGRAAKEMSVAEKQGIVVPSDGGSNDPPVDEAIADQIAAAVERAGKITKVTNADEARAANDLAEKLQSLWRLGDAERDKEKRPHDDASKAVQAKWLPIITPAETERKRLIAVAKAWIAEEERRVAKEAADKRKAEQARIDAENEKIRKANIEAAGNAPAGSEPELQPELAPAPVVEPPKVQAQSSVGRAVGLKKVTRGEITDEKAFALALLDKRHPEFLALMQTLANRAAKAGVPLDGMKIVETRE